MAVLYIYTKFRRRATGLSPFFFSEKKEKNMNYKESFVIYESVYAQFERMLKADDIKGAASYIDAVMQYGLYGALPDEDSPVWLYGLDNVIASIDSAKARYREKIDIPEDELIDCLKKGMTNDEIAEYFNCSARTITRRKKAYGINAEVLNNYVDFEAEATEKDMKKTDSYHSHSLSYSDFYSDKHYEKDNIKK